MMIAILIILALFIYGLHFLFIYFLNEISNYNVILSLIIYLLFIFSYIKKFDKSLDDKDEYYDLRKNSIYVIFFIHLLFYFIILKINH